MATGPDLIRVLVVDDHPLLREGIAAILGNQSDMALVAEAGDGTDAMAKCRLHRPDVMLLDLQMPGLHGIDAIVAIRDEFPHVRIIVLTTYGGDDLARRALRAGAQAYLLKSTARKDLVATIRAVAAGRRLVQPEVAEELALHMGSEPLTAREMAVLKLIAAGRSNKLIAFDLSISEETVKGHVKSIPGKLHASDRTHAVTIAIKRGIVDVI